ncbi:MAG TPA: thiamine pyrophosphate-dependent enzyme [Hyphomicrobiaceae bacterium]|nr:thiamine pyrophosphate-dependent enzyme [Hyphomicrobiaceae bacterium]
MAQTNLAKLNAAEVVVKTLIANGIKELYCLPGVQNDDFFDALARIGGAIRPIHTRHEQATAYMALGAALATGKPQAYCVVPGIGFLNASTPLATAQSLTQPVLCISGHIVERYIGKGYGYLHEIPNQLGIMKTLTKWAEHIGGAEDAGPKIREAFRQLNSGVPGPVGISCGWDRWKHAGEVAFDDEAATRRTPAIDLDQVKAAAKLLGKAKKPLIVVGGGAQGASAEVTALANMLEAPVAANRTGQGVLDSRHHLAIRNVYAHRIWKDVDVVLAIGTRLQQHQIDWGLDDDIKVIHLDIDPTRIGRITKPEVGIIADAAEGVRALIDALAKHNMKRASRKEEMAELKARVGKELEVLAPQKAWVDAIRRTVPEDGIVVEELTQISYASRFLYPVYKPRTYISSGYQGTLGWGLSTALGVKVAMPDRAVLSINGDGGFMFGVQELATAVRHNIPLVSVVFTDDAYGNVRRMQAANYEGRVIASDLKNPDFVKLGESFGVRSERAKTPDALAKALGTAFKAKEPSLIEVPVGEFPDPWKLVFLGRVRGTKPG